MADVSSIEGAAMSEREIGEFLREQGIGILSLATGSDAYAVPISFGYDDAPRRLYFDLIRFGEASEKIDFVDRTHQACFVTYSVQSRFDWQSVIALGEIDTVDEDEEGVMDQVMADNAWFPSLFPPDEPMTGVRRSVLVIDEATGRKGEGTK